MKLWLGIIGLATVITVANGWGLVDWVATVLMYAVLGYVGVGVIKLGRGLYERLLKHLSSKAQGLRNDTGDER